MIAPKTSKILKTSIKIIIVLASWIFVGYKISNFENIENLGSYFSDLNTSQIVYLVLILLLMPINWLLEAIKWRNLIFSIEKLGIFKSLLAVWTGVTIGSITPNRIGEFGGRILFLKKENRITASGLTLYGDLSQFIITFCIGLSSFLVLIKFYLLNSTIQSFETVVIAFSLIAIIISSFIYFKINWIVNYLKKIKIFKKLSEKFNKFEEIPTKLKIKTLFFSALRYLIFTSQFYFSLRFFKIEIGITETFISIASVYLASTVIPNIPFAEIGIRLSFSTIFIGLFTPKVAEILLSSTMIYLINVLFPIIFGGITILFNDKCHVFRAN